MRHELRLFLVALQFLSRVPVPRWVGYQPAWLQDCLRHFPLVGALLGLWAGAWLLLGLSLWSVPVAAALALAALVWLSGGFHEDGLADSFDALGGTVSRERALEIMKDSRIGSYGALALLLVLGLKLALWTELAAQPLAALAALVWAQAVSRVAPVALVWSLPYAGDADHAKAKPLALQLSGAGLAVALAWCALLGAGLAFWQPEATPALLRSTLAAVLSAALCRLWLKRRLGGFTGDTLGATQQLSELAILLAWSAHA